MSHLNVLPRSLLMLATLAFCSKPFADTIEFDSQKFIEAASLRSISEVETAKVALQKSATPAVQAYAQAMIAENNAHLDALRTLANEQHLTMLSDDELQAKAHKYVFERKGQSFDRAYVGMRAAERRKTVNLYRQAINLGDESFKHYAESALPVLMQELYQAQELLQAIDATPSSLIASNP